jgi:hypothetical protein
MMLRPNDPNVQIGYLPHPLSEMGATTCYLTDTKTENHLENALLETKAMELALIFLATSPKMSFSVDNFPQRQSGLFTFLEFYL